MKRPLWSNWREFAFDAAPLAAVVGVISSVVILAGIPLSMVLWYSVALDVLVGLALLFFRRTAPELCLAVTTGAALVTLGGELLSPGIMVSPYDPTRPWLSLGTPFAIYSAMKYSDRKWPSWAMTVVMLVIAWRPWQLIPMASPYFDVRPSAILYTILPAVLGLYNGARRRLIQALTERAERAEREQDLLAEQARADERVKLATEMHDVVTHRLSLMVLQAGALRITAGEEATRNAAEDLRAAGCQALEELRDLVGVLRSGPRTDEVIPEDGSSSATLDLTELIEESRSVGVHTELIEDGNPLLASPVVGRTAYRVVQEALTNARKHAPGAWVRVYVRYSGDRLRLIIRNSAAKSPLDPSLAGSGSGSGLLGLRQRVELVHGRLRAGPTDSGGFEVDAILPAYVPTVGGQHDEP
ncbi:histidine kinase [Allokutzneria sp. A3M-2-11 16]|uniref:sensor histidine kinase n=1 Tax=Allokutzneria sp. A3M-2-11 16 TaxID=2962043 RepID=UPI0020B8E172|nr:histidine kinase [Allokutzneria sp. A3M-2-11 16]MCP3798492.1 histidine kinase [Allokutzneria sp. A3M-2-11 16]